MVGRKDINLADNIEKMAAANKKYMIIAVSVLIAEFTARNNGGAARQESSPQSLTGDFANVVRYAGKPTCNLDTIK